MIFSVEGSGFLYHMVRTMVGTVLEIGHGPWRHGGGGGAAWTPERVPAIIASKDRQQAGPCVLPMGLCLQWIRFGP